MLRLGCSGCLTVLVLLAVIGGAAWCVYAVWQTPEITAVAGSPADGHRAQQKVFDLLRRAGAGRSHTAALTEAEVNAFVRNHLGGETDLPQRNLGVRLPAEGQAEIVGRVSVRQLLHLPPFSVVAGVLPERVLAQEVWLTVVTGVTVETVDGARERRRLRLDVKRLRLGRLPLPEVMLRILFDPSTLRLLRWHLPQGIEEIRIEPGRVVIRAGP